MPDILHGVNWFLIVIIGVALLFDYTNGFHDSANAIATVVSTRVMSPTGAILMSATLNFVGALVSTNVAKTIAQGLVDQHAATQGVILAAVLGAIVWNLITWRFGIPSSSSHALIGGLLGASIVHSGLHSVLWHGVVSKVLLPMVISPVIGALIAFILMTSLFVLFSKAASGRVSSLFHHLQRLSAAAMAYNHGLNDAQKTMGVITLALVAFHLLPGGDKTQIPLWVVLSCATAMALGTAAGGWRIMRTMGQRIIRLEPVNGFAAETAASIVIWVASYFGMPVSTTHVISGSIFGVGISKRLAGVRWGVAQRMVTAWGLTLPAAALVAGVCLLVIKLMGHAHLIAQI